MNEQFHTILSIAIIPQVISLIAQKEKIVELSAINQFYQSKVYQLLSIEETKVWHYSPLTLYFMWKSEMMSGEIVFPEET